MSNFFLRGGASGVSPSKSAKSAAQYYASATAVGFGGSTYTAAGNTPGPGEIRNAMSTPGILSEVKVHIQGVGLVVRAEATVISYGASPPGFLSGILGNDFSISMPQISETFKCYDLSFSNIKPAGWEVTVKGMAANDVRNYDFIDISGGTIPPSETFGQSIARHINDLVGGTVNLSSMPKVMAAFASPPSALEGVVRKGRSLADYVEAQCLALKGGITGTVQDFFQIGANPKIGSLFQAGGDTPTDELFRSLGSSIPPTMYPGSGYRLWQCFGLTAMREHENLFLQNGFCGWVSLDQLTSIMNNHVLTPLGRTLSFSSNYSAVSAPSDSRWVGANPFEHIMFHTGTSFFIRTTQFNTVPNGFTITVPPSNSGGPASAASSTAGSVVSSVLNRLLASNVGTPILKYSDFSSVGSTPENIWLSTTLIRRIQEELMKASASVGEDTPLQDRMLGAFPFGRFMEKIFDIIRGGTGGIIDLTLDMERGDTNIYIVSRKPSSAPTSAGNIALGTRADNGYGIRDVKINGNVPKSLAARLFGEGPQVDGVNKAISAPSAPTAPDWNLAETSLAMGNAGGIHRETSDTILDGNNKIGVAEVQTIATMDPPALPTEIHATVDASGGIDVFQAVNISPGLAAAGGSGVIWGITDVTHKASGTDAVTEFKAIARLKG